MATKNNIEIFRGEVVLLNFTMSPTVDITGWTIQFFCGELTVNATIVSGGGGIFSVSLSRTNTAAWTPGTKRYDIWRTDSNSDVVLAYGAIEVMDVARETS